MTSREQQREQSIGIVEKQFFTFAESPNEITLESGASLGPVTIAYETYGELNEAKNNALLIVHAFSGDSHVAGYYDDFQKTEPGWWESMVGPGKGIDTNRFFVICSNILGGCQGTTGPSSINPKNGKPFGLDFPMVTIGDMVDCQKKLVDHLQIKQLIRQRLIALPI